MRANKETESEITPGCVERVGCVVMCCDAVHDLQGMGCDLEHFVVKWDQQYTEDEQACMVGVGIVLSNLTPR